jgi:phage terminase large subunit-like protein
VVTSQKHADFACQFFEVVLRHTADDWWGEPFVLCGWQEEALNEIFGNLDEHDNRIIDMVYLEVPKKAGKTEFAAGLALLTLVSTKTPGCQVYGAAAATRQALQVYRAACKMVEQSGWLRKQLRIMRGTNRILKRKDPDSFYAAVAADGDFGDGVNPAFVVADEVHRWKTRKQIENWDVLSKGGITRRQCLAIAITTAGVQNESPLAWKLHEKTRRIKEGIVTDHRFYGKIYAAAPEDDPADPATWYKANPSLVRLGEDGKVRDGFIPEDRIRKEYQTAESEGDLTAFKRYFLNIWDQKENRALEIAKWDGSAGEWTTPGLLPKLPEDTVRTLPHEFMARFFQRTCWAGVDLSMTTDLTSVAFLFPGEEDSFDVLPFFWVPEARVRKLELKLGAPLSQWIRDGYLEATPGEVIDYRFVQDRLEWGAQMFDLQEICWDPWNSRQVSVAMVENGYQCFEVRQGYQSLSEPSKKILTAVARGKLHHGGDPVLRWNASCLATISRNDNLMFAKPEREKSTSRIDGISAITNAMARAMLGEQNVYSGTVRSVG